jgi:hypothetical protein
MKTIPTRCLQVAASAATLMFGWTGAVCADSDASGRAAGQLPVSQIQKIIEIQGTIENGVLDLEVERNDIGNVGGPLGPLSPGGPQVPQVTFDGAFEVNGDIFFQPLFGGLAFLNADQPLKEEELQPFIFTLLQNGLIFQAFHQHLPMHPQVWFVHYRGIGNAIALANAVHAALSVTSTPLPQAPPSNPTTPLNVNTLKTILHADEISVGDEGVVTAWIYRKNLEVIDGIPVNPQANISTNVEFKPLDNNGTADVVPDFSMTSPEVVPVDKLMLNKLGWYQGCLYNQETNEYPQLFFSHMLKTGDAYELAGEVRRGLDQTDSA